MKVKNITNINRVITYIEKNLNEKLDLTTIAKSVGYSKFHLHRMFASTVGLSIHDYVQRRQISEAAKLLVFSKKSILEISLIAGYASQQAFSDVFKQMYKCSPKTYRSKKEFYPLQVKFILKEELSSTILPLEIKREITYATLEEVPFLLEFAHLTIDGFPNLDEKEFLSSLKKCIEEKRALILKHQEILIAMITFDDETGRIGFFAIHPLYRKHGIAKVFLDKLMHEVIVDKEISITTYREGDKADTGYRKELLELGFTKAELLMEYGYPTQRLVFIPITETM